MNIRCYGTEKANTALDRLADLDYQQPRILT